MCSTLWLVKASKTITNNCINIVFDTRNPTTILKGSNFLSSVKYERPRAKVHFVFSYGQGFRNFSNSRFLRTMASNYFPQVSLLPAAATRVPLFSSFFLSLFLFFWKIVFLFTFPSRTSLKKKNPCSTILECSFASSLKKKKKR